MTTRTDRRQRRAGAPQTTPRHVWLAALGALSIARREAGAGAEAALAAAQRARQDAQRIAADARDVARGIAMTAEERLQPALSRVGGDLEARISTLLSRLGANGRGSAQARASVRRKAARRRRA
jgi:hypothetical protein